MEELIYGTEPSISVIAFLLSRQHVILHPAGVPKDISRWYTASFWGTIACIILYTAFGLIFVHLHAHELASQMSLLGHYSMTMLIKPDDVHLMSPSHLLGSALFFGLTLGVLNALACMAITLPPWTKGIFTRSDIASSACVVFISIYFSFSRELPLVSIICGLLCPVVFILAWLYVVRKPFKRQVCLKRWAVLSCILVVPLAGLVISRSSFLSIRDSMLSMVGTRGISDFYYEHTLLAADVIKPVSSKDQNVIAFQADMGNIGETPHGTLWIRTHDPCAVRGATIVAGRGDLKCRSVTIPNDGLPANYHDRIIEKYGKGIDPNSYMRRGIGFFFRYGPLVIIAALILSWWALGIEQIFARNRIIALLLLLGYLLMFAPMFYGSYLAAYLKSHPENLYNYAAARAEQERYIAVVTYPGALTDEELLQLMNDPSERIRINAVIEAGERRSPAFIPTILTRLHDPRMNVRTKACWALGVIGSDETLGQIEKAARDDPSWYVREYAYEALGRMKPETSVVSLNK